MKSLTFEQAPGFNKIERNRLAMIWRRILFLEDRIKTHRGDPSFDIQEAISLRWLLNAAKMPGPPKNEEIDGD